MCAKQRCKQKVGILAQTNTSVASDWTHHISHT